MAIGPNSAAVRLDKFAHNREAQPEPDRSALLALLLGEPVKYVRQEIRSNTAAVIGDPDLSVRIRLFNNNVDPTLFRRELNSIRQQVPNDLLYTGRIAGDDDERLWNANVENELSGTCLRANRVH